MTKKIIHIAADHGGFELKVKLINYLKTSDYIIDDLGTYSVDSVDYPEFGFKAAEAVLKDGCPAIIICGTGIGISIAANRKTGIRAALCNSTEYAKLAREHNNANILALGGRFTDEKTAIAITEVFLNTDFIGGRHQRRTDMLDQI